MVNSKDQMETAARQPVESPVILEPNHLRKGEVEICSLHDGGCFKMANTEVDGKKVVVTGWTYGRKLFHNDCRARVYLPGTNQHHVVFGEGATRRTFTASGAAEVNWPTMLGVVPLTSTEYERDTQPASFRQPHEGESGDEMVDAKVIKAHVAKYKFQLTSLGKATEAGDEAGLATAQARLIAVKEAAEAAGVDVVAEHKVAQAKETPNSNLAVAPIKAAKKLAGPKLTAREKMDATIERRAAAKAAKPAKAPREKKLPTMNACLCCGDECGGLFRPGHDARAKGMIYAVERGTAKFDDLPATLKPHVKFAGRSATAGKENGDYRIVQAPVKFPGRDDIKVVKPAA